MASVQLGGHCYTDKISSDGLTGRVLKETREAHTLTNQGQFDKFAVWLHHRDGSLERVSWQRRIDIADILELKPVSRFGRNK